MHGFVLTFHADGWVSTEFETITDYPYPGEGGGIGFARWRVSKSGRLVFTDEIFDSGDPLTFNWASRSDGALILWNQGGKRYELVRRSQLKNRLRWLDRKW